MDSVRRCVLFNYNSEDKTIDFRHFGIRVTPVGLSRGVKKLVQSKVPSLARYQDVSEYLLRYFFVPLILNLQFAYVRLFKVHSKFFKSAHLLLFSPLSHPKPDNYSPFRQSDHFCHLSFNLIFFDFLSYQNHNIIEVNY